MCPCRDSVPRLDNLVSRSHVLFSSAIYQRAVCSYRKRVQLSDEILYKLCRDHPNHKDPAAVHAKLSLIGRSYATGIERLLRSESGQSDTLKAWGRYFGENACELNRLVRGIRGIAEPLDRSKLVRIAEAHGRLVKLVSRKTRGMRRPTAFASKYLHFHGRAVPIYDSWADAGAGRHRLLMNSRDTLGRMPRAVDKNYWRFLRHFWCVYQEALKALGHESSARHLDRYLLEIASPSKEKRR
jgi:hypothetical protein